MEIDELREVMRNMRIFSDLAVIAERTGWLGWSGSEGGSWASDDIGLFLTVISTVLYEIHC